MRDLPAIPPAASMAALPSPRWTGAGLLITIVIIIARPEISSMNAAAPKDIAALLKEERDLRRGADACAGLDDRPRIHAGDDRRQDAGAADHAARWAFSSPRSRRAMRWPKPSPRSTTTIRSARCTAATRRRCMDTVLGVSVHTMMDKGQGYTTLEFKISFIKAITKDTGPDPRRRPRAERRPPRRDRRSASARRERTAARARDDDVPGVRYSAAEGGVTT